MLAFDAGPLATFVSVGEHVKIHIATAGYLRRFTNAHGHIQTVRPADPTRRIPSRGPETVGYRSRYFVDPRSQRPPSSGSPATESAGLRSLRKIDTTWPLESDELFEDRLHIACLVAIHMVRNEAFKQHTARLQSRNLAQKLPEYDFEAAREEVFLRELTSEGFRVDHMLGMIPKMASMIASAHWSLIEFPAPLLATGDQPVTVVPLLADGVAATVQPNPDHGFLLTEEMRFPIDPQRALLFTWANEPDAPPFAVLTTSPPIKPRRDRPGGSRVVSQPRPPSHATADQRATNRELWACGPRAACRIRRRRGNGISPPPGCRRMPRSDDRERSHGSIPCGPDFCCGLAWLHGD